MKLKILRKEISQRLDKIIKIQIILLSIIFIIIQLHFYNNESIKVQNIIYLCISILFILLEMKLHKKNKYLDELTSLKEEIIKEKKKYKSVIEAANDAIWEFNLDKNELYISEKWTNITGYDLSYEQSNLEFIKDIIHNDDIQRVKKRFKQCMNGKAVFFQDEFRVKTKSEEYKWIFVKGKAVINESENIEKILGAITDISDKKNIEEDIKYLAYYDTLTGLPNKALLSMQYIRKMKKVSNFGVLILLDLDNFKNINDTLGHDYGDELLIKISEILKEYVSRNVIISRTGGDEFLILIDNTIDKIEIERFCDEILGKLIEPFEIKGKQVYTSASIGAAVFPDDGVQFNELLRNAETAMYEAKANGKNKYCFFKGNMKDELIRKTEVEKMLRNALEKEEFYVKYQPQVDLSKNKVVGFEGLLRWKNDKLGNVSPGEFIPIAEQTGLIIPIGNWVIENSFLQCKKWIERGFEFESLAVNISPIQLKDESFIDNIRSLIKQMNIDPKYIELEITENMLIQNFNKSIELLNELTNMGFKIALDDFGTGYSSLSYLKKLPIKTLKIDKSFVDNIDYNRDDKALVDSIINLSHNINLKVVAEGVEYIEQVNILKFCKCDYCQGYYFSKPISEKEIETKFFNKNY